MADNINIRNGEASFVSKKELAWHRLGKVVDSMTSKEAIELSGLDYEVEKVPLYFANENLALDAGSSFDYNHVRRINHKEGGGSLNPLINVANSYATVRTDDYTQLGVVGQRYEVIQNIEAFDFFDRIVGEGHAMYETAGALGNGETIFVTAKIPSKMIVAKDEIDKYLLFTNSHDGSSAVNILFTPVRVVCNNTLTAALRGAKNKYVVRHTISAQEKLKLAEITLGIVSKQSEVLEELFTQWSKEYLEDDSIDDILESALGLKRDKEGKLSTRADNMLTSIKDYHESGVGQSHIRGTKWGVFNAVSGYYQNVKEYKTDDRMFETIYQSTALNRMQDTFNELLTIQN